MKYLLVALLFITDPLQLAKINGLKKDATLAYTAGNYEKAASKYSLLADSLGIREDEVLLNLAHSYFRLGDTSNAKMNYQSVTASSNKNLKSIAAQQLGVLAKDGGKLEESLSHLKNSIKSNPTNAGAKYDYEVVKKLLEAQQKQDQENKDNKENDENKDEDQEKKDQDKQDQQDKDKQGEKDKEEKSDQEKQDQEKKDGEKSEEEKAQEEKEKQEQEGEKTDEEKKKEMDEATKKKLEEMGISQEKAQMILEALKNNEVQYIQQRKRQATERPDSGKPDW